MFRRSRPLKRVVIAAVPLLVFGLSGCGSSATTNSADTVASTTSAAVATIAAAGSTAASMTPTPSSTTSSASATSSSAATPARLDEATKAKLQHTFEKSFGTSFADGVQTPGAVAYVSIGTQVWVGTLGVSDVGTSTAVRRDDRGRIGSVSKPFVATAVLTLVKDGKLSLDDPLGRHVSGIANGDIITVRQLLSMSAGVWSYTNDADLIARFQSNPMASWTIDKSIDLMRAHPADYPPGKKTVYSDSNYVLLGRIVELVTHQPIGEVITSRVIKPLGLPGTRMPADDEPGVPDPSISSYMPVKGKLVAVPKLDPNFAWTAGAMASTVDDLATFARELTDGTLLTPELQAERLKISRFDGVAFDAGYGLGLIRINHLLGHTGAINGGGASVFRYPERDATVVVMVNASSNFENTVDLTANALLTDLYADQVVTRPHS